jgi:hypothetical protein
VTPHSAVDSLPERADAAANEAGRLRDLHGRDRHIALAMFVLLLVPFVVAIVRAYHDKWIPSGDEANIATRALEVFSRHPPLTGLPTTSYLYGEGIVTNHPGPMEFYLLAIPLRLLGMTAGPLFTAAAINGACVMIVCWVFFRRLGLNAMLWAGALLLAVMWSGGTAVLVDTLSSNMTMYSLLCTAVLVWAVIDGDRRLLPLTAFVASYAAQQHLANALLVFALVAAMTVVIVVQVLAARRGSATAPRGSLRNWTLAALGVAIVCWSPVLIQQFTGHPGNLTAVLRFARDNNRPTLGFSAAWHQIVHAIAPNGVLTRTDASGDVFIAAPGPSRAIAALAFIGALVAIIVRHRRRFPSLARLASVALVVIVAGLANGSNVPRGFESVRVNLYRWTWTAAFLTWAAIGIALAPIVRRAVERLTKDRVPRRLAPVALLVVAAFTTMSILVVRGTDDHNREVKEFAVERRLDREVLARIDRKRPVLVTQIGQDATLSLAPHLIFLLLQHGVHVEVNQNDAKMIYGNYRRYRLEPSIQTLAIATGPARNPHGRGELVMWKPYGPGRTAEFNDLVSERSALLDELATEVRGKRVVLAPGAVDRINQMYPGLAAFTINSTLKRLSADPLVALGSPTIQSLLRQGIVQSPALDQSKLIALSRLPRGGDVGTWGDEQAEAYLLNSYWTEYCTKVPCFSPS